MSYFTNTELAEQLGEYEEEAKNSEQEYEDAKVELKNANEWLAKKELNYYKSKLDLAMFKIRMQKDG